MRGREEEILGKQRNHLCCNRKNPGAGESQALANIRRFAQIRSPYLGYFSLLAPAGVFVYVVGFALPFELDIPLILLVATSVLGVLVHSDRDGLQSRTPYILVALFLVSLGLSVVVSDDVGRSLRLSASMLPALLLFFVITEYFHDTRDVRLLYLAFSLVGIGLPILLFWAAWEHPGERPGTWAAYTGSPILVTSNDLAFLSVIAPLSLALFLMERRHVFGVIAVVSLVLSACAVVLYQSRGATLAMLVGLVGIGLFLKPSLALIFGGGALVLMVAMDALFGFRLLERFDDPFAGRLAHWRHAWEAFLARPFLGQGSHTYVLFDRKAAWPHNIYVEALAGQGIIGLASLLSLLGYGAWTLWQKGRGLGCRIKRTLAAGAFGGIAGFCFSGVFELSLLRQWVVVMLFVLFGVTAKLCLSHIEKG